MKRLFPWLLALVAVSAQTTLLTTPEAVSCFLGVPHLDNALFGTQKT